MIEEIIRPDQTLWIAIFIGGLAMMFGGIIVSMGLERFKTGIGIMLFGAIIFLGLIVYPDSDGLNSWNNSVQEQINSLHCEDLQEAFELYKKEYIKEKFVFECVDTREMWWK